MLTTRFLRFTPVRRIATSIGDLGSGDGKSGGSGGAIRQAGGAFGRLEAAREEKFFHDLNEQQIIALKQELEAKANSASGEQLKELTNKIDLLSREAERQRNVISKKPVPE